MVRGWDLVGLKLVWIGSPSAFAYAVPAASGAFRRPSWVRQGRDGARRAGCAPAMGSAIMDRGRAFEATSCWPPCMSVTHTQTPSRCSIAHPPISRYVLRKLTPDRRVFRTHVPGDKVSNEKMIQIKEGNQAARRRCQKTISAPPSLSAA